MKHFAKAIAHANIALAKYWGKADVVRNTPAVPSLSLTLSGLTTTTRVSFDPAFEADSGSLDGKPLAGKELKRVSELLDRVRARAGVNTFARVESENDFPTAAGLASSASGFAALALAATHAAGLDLSPQEISGWARQSSASAARSLFGGYVALDAGAEEAEPIAPTDHFPLHMLVATTVTGPKKVGSTDGMLHTAQTSPYYRAWVESAPATFETAKRAVLERDVHTLGAAVEHSALAMHASMLAARPAIRYFAPATLGVLDLVLELRERGLVAYATMDAGPHVKVLTTPADVEAVETALRASAAVQAVLRCSGGPDARIVEAG